MPTVSALPVSTSLPQKIIVDLNKDTTAKIKNDEVEMSQFLVWYFNDDFTLVTNIDFVQMETTHGIFTTAYLIRNFANNKAGRQYLQSLGQLNNTFTYLRKFKFEM